MKSTAGLLFCGFFLLNNALGINDTASSDVVYVWAYHGLTLRAEPSPKGKKIKTIPYGEKIIITAKSTEHPFEVTELGNYTLKGFWVKVRFGDLEGYVFNGYLSQLPVRRVVVSSEHYSLKKVGASVVKEYSRSLEDFEIWATRAFGLEYENRFVTCCCDGADCNHQKFEFKNGIKVNIDDEEMVRGWVTVSIPNISFNEAYLFYLTEAECSNNRKNLEAGPLEIQQDTNSVTIEGDCGGWRMTREGNLIVFGDCCAC